MLSDNFIQMCSYDINGRKMTTHTHTHTYTHTYNTMNLTILRIFISQIWEYANKRDDILQKRPMIWRSLLIVATSYENRHQTDMIWARCDLFMWVALLIHSHERLDDSENFHESDMMRWAHRDMFMRVTLLIHPHERFDNSENLHPSDMIIWDH